MAAQNYGWTQYETDSTDMEFFLDLVIVAALTTEDEPEDKPDKPKRVFIDQVL